MKQRTILRESSLKGKALHTGDEVELTFKPAPENTGIVFRRNDLYGKPEVKPAVELVSEVIRSTTISSGHTKIHTIEHVLSAARGLGIDNIYVEMNASEPPIMDGSSRPFTQALLQAEPVEQDAERNVYKVEQPISVTDGNRSLIALPYDGFRVTCTSTDDRGIHTQHLSIDIDPETYLTQIAPARTFTIYEEIEELLKLGKIQGGSLDSAVVIRGDKILSKEPLRFTDEFVRHKILDIVGDLALLDYGLQAHIIAVRPGHALNAKLAGEIVKHRKSKEESKKTPTTESQHLAILKPDETNLDIRRVLNTLPHRYPFVMIDRVLNIGEEDITAVKNVTINEPYFQGHYPGNPVMPGVLQIEAMAQAAGILMLRKVELGNKVAFFMSANKVKFRQAVRPGDQLLIKVKLTKVRGNKIGIAEAECFVDDKPVSSAEVMFTFAEANDM